MNDYTWFKSVYLSMVLFVLFSLLQVLLVTVLRHRQVPRVELTSTIAYRSNHLCGSANAIAGVDAAPTTVMPMSSLLYAVSLAVHQPILSAIGCYDLGNDINLKNLGGTLVVQIV